MASEPKLTLAAFDVLLRKHCTSTAMRPFVCMGSPLDCRVFLVGHNPATNDDKFWDHWSVNGGFEYKGWFEEYRRHRLRSGDREMTPTRRRIRHFTDELKPIPVLETNVFAMPSEKAGALPPEHRNSELFRFLLREIRPSVVVTHGKPAVEAVSEFFGVALPRGAEVDLDDGTRLVAATWHFSGQGAPKGTMNDDYVRGLARRVAKLLTP
jgi:hypothetical protein